MNLIKVLINKNRRDPSIVNSLNSKISLGISFPTVKYARMSAHRRLEIITKEASLKDI